MKSPSLRCALQGSVHPASRVTDIFFLLSLQVLKCVQGGFWPLVQRMVWRRGWELLLAWDCCKMVSGPSMWLSWLFLLRALSWVLGWFLSHWWETCIKTFLFFFRYISLGGQGFPWTSLAHHSDPHLLLFAQSVWGCHGSLDCTVYTGACGH